MNTNKNNNLLKVWLVATVMMGTGWEASLPVAAAVPNISVMADNNGVLKAPMKLFSANSNLVNATIGTITQAVIMASPLTLEDTVVYTNVNNAGASWSVGNDASPGNFLRWVYFGNPGNSMTLDSGGLLTAVSLAGSGAAITAINAANAASGTLAEARLYTNVLRGITPFKVPTRLVFFGASLTGDGGIPFQAGVATYPFFLTNSAMNMTNVAQVIVCATAGLTEAQLTNSWWATIAANAPAGGTNACFFPWGTLNDVYANSGAGTANLILESSNIWNMASALGYQVFPLTLIDIPYTHTNTAFVNATADTTRRNWNAAAKRATNYTRLIDADGLLTDYLSTTYNGLHTSTNSGRALGYEVARVLAASGRVAALPQGSVVGVNTNGGVDLFGVVSASGINSSLALSSNLPEAGVTGLVTDLALKAALTDLAAATNALLRTNGNASALTNVFGRQTRFAFIGDSISCNNTVIQTNWPQIFITNYSRMFGSSVAFYTNTAAESKLVTTMVSEYPNGAGNAMAKPPADQDGFCALQGGINDIFADDSAEHISSNLVKIALMAKADNWKVIGLGIPYDFAFSAARSNVWYNANTFLRASNAWYDFIATDALIKWPSQTIDATVHWTTNTMFTMANAYMAVVLRASWSGDMFAKNVYTDQVLTRSITSPDRLTVGLGSGTAGTLTFTNASGATLTVSNGSLTISEPSGSGRNARMMIGQDGVYGMDLAMQNGAGTISISNTFAGIFRLTISGAANGGGGVKIEANGATGFPVGLATIPTNATAPADGATIKSWLSVTNDSGKWGKIPVYY